MNSACQYNNDISRWLDDYEACKRPVQVDFRSLVRIDNLDRLTHFLHPYPAKLLQHIPIFFLNNTILSDPGDVVFDPFLGSGTVAVEAIASGRDFVGFDINPFAVLLSSVKCTRLSERAVTESVAILQEQYDHEDPEECTAINYAYWYSDNIIRQLSVLKKCILRFPNDRVRDFFKICFSLCARKVSFEDPRIIVPVKLNTSRYAIGHRLRTIAENKIELAYSGLVLDIFNKIVAASLQKIKNLDTSPKDCCASFEVKDSRSLEADLINKKAQIIITSPPYPGAQKYIRSTGLPMTWLEMCRCEDISKLKKMVVGREEVSKNEYRGDFFYNDARCLMEKVHNRNPERASILEKYLYEMHDSIRSFSKMVKNGGWLVMVAANSVISGIEVPTQDYLVRMTRENGFAVRMRLIDTIKSRGLMTKRNKTANMISCEWVNVFERV